MYLAFSGVRPDIQYKDFQIINITLLHHQVTPVKLDCISEEIEEALPELPLPTCTTEEAMRESEDRSVSRSYLVSLVRKHQKDLREELSCPGELKKQWSGEELVKVHRIQVVLHVVWFCDFTDRDEEGREKTQDGMLALLRSLSFLTSPKEMFLFLSDQVIYQ